MPFRSLFLAIAGTLAFVCAPLHASTPPPTATSLEVAPGTPAVDLPAPRIKASLRDYRQWLDKLAQRHAAAGLATAVVINNKVVFEYTLGDADTATHEPVTPHTVFRLASLSKASDAASDWGRKAFAVAVAAKAKAPASKRRTPGKT